MRRRNKGGSRPRLTSVIVSILLVLICLGGAGSALASDAQGKTRTIQNGVITKIEAQTHDGSGPQGDTGQWDVFRLHAEFALPNGTVHAGDTTTMKLPDKLKFNQTSSFEIKDAGGNVVANATIDGGTKTLTLTYTEFVENNSDITGASTSTFRLPEITSTKRNTSRLRLT